jgi:hypothetical protein
MNFKKCILVFCIFTTIVLLLTSFANASMVVEISVEKPIITAEETQTLTATVNHKGTGVIFVVQPDPAGQSWLDYLNSHPYLKVLWNRIPENIRNEINEEIGTSIVSYALVDFKNYGGGSKTFSFPEDFTGLTGQPSTATHGEYTVLFAYLSTEHGCCCYKYKLSFDCTQWFYLPESPLGSAMAIFTPFLALATVVSYKKTRHIKA